VFIAAHVSMCARKLGVCCEFMPISILTPGKLLSRSKGIGGGAVVLEKMFADSSMMVEVADGRRKSAAVKLMPSGRPGVTGMYDNGNVLLSVGHRN